MMRVSYKVNRYTVIQRLIPLHSTSGGSSENLTLSMLSFWQVFDAVLQPCKPVRSAYSANVLRLCLTYVIDRHAIPHLMFVDHQQVSSAVSQRKAVLWSSLCQQSLEAKTKTTTCPYSDN